MSRAPLLPLPQVLEAYFEGTMPDEETIHKLIRKGTIKRDFVPMVCGTAFKNKGVQPLLDAVIAYLPSPLDVEAIAGVDVNDPEKEMSRPPRCADECQEHLSMVIHQPMHLSICRFSSEIRNSTHLIIVVQQL